MRNLISKIAHDRDGVTAIEYGMIAAFIALALVVSIPGISTTLQATFASVSSNLAPAS